MRESKSIDFAKLLGFEVVSGQLAGGLDFQDEAIGAKLGAKMGPGDEVEPVAPIEPSKPR